MMEVYLDNSATTMCYPEVGELVYKVMCRDYGNPSSMHRKGVQAEHYIREAKETLAKLMKVNPGEIFFTSGGTESDNWAIKAAAEAYESKGKHIITSKIEHHAVLHTCEYLEKHGFEVTYLNVDENGVVDLEELKKAEHYIFMEYFIIGEGYMWDSILDVLKEKAANGVEVRLIYDDLGCVNTLPPQYYRTLQSYGIRCAAFNQFRPVLNVVMNNRDHRKITVIDGHTAFTGGINLADEYIKAKTAAEAAEGKCRALEAENTALRQQVNRNNAHHPGNRRK